MVDATYRSTLRFVIIGHDAHGHPVVRDEVVGPVAALRQYREICAMRIGGRVHVREAVSGSAWPISQLAEAAHEAVADDVAFLAEVAPLQPSIQPARTPLRLVVDEDFRPALTASIEQSKARRGAL